MKLHRNVSIISPRHERRIAYARGAGRICGVSARDRCDCRHAGEGACSSAQSRLMDRQLRHKVRTRAGGACEYCRIPQSASPFIAFHVEHIVARQHGGLDELDNLALACSHCNFHKGPNIAALDPVTGGLSPLFHPRLDTWNDHFKFAGTTVVGVTNVGRAAAVPALL